MKKIKIMKKEYFFETKNKEKVKETNYCVMTVRNILKETDKAFLVEIEYSDNEKYIRDYSNIYIPKSHIYMRRMFKTGYARLYLPVWLAKKIESDIMLVENIEKGDQRVFITMDEMNADYSYL